MPSFLLAAANDPTATDVFLQHCLTGLTNGMLIALIALGYTMVYGIVELVNFAHGDLVMLGSFLALSLLGALLGPDPSTAAVVGSVALLLVVVPAFCGGLNWAVDRIVYVPLRKAPRLAPLVSAIGVSFLFMNVGQVWKGAYDLAFPDLVPRTNLLAGDAVRYTAKDLLVACTTIPTMVALTLFVKFTKLGQAMRATAQDPLAAQLMGIPSDRVIGATFAIGGGLGGVASVVYGLYINQVSFQMGFTNGLYAFTAAVLGGIGKLPGAVLGGLIIGLVRSMGSGYLGERWTSPLIFAILIVILVFRPAGLLGDSRREKV
jgi:branched-chain amino acid transport system permease protein